MDPAGFFYPAVDSSRCIECGACERVCPFIPDEESFNYPRHAYAARIKSVSEQHGSSSGGAAYAIGRLVLQDGGVVYGCTAEKLDIKHIRVEDLENLSSLRGSKYVQSNVNDLFVRVRSDLKSGRRVAFIGTPCQVYGLRKFLMKDYDNLLCVDLICHGTPSQKMLHDHVRYIARGACADSISFRKGNTFSLCISSQGTDIWNADVWAEPMKDMYYRAFIDGLSYRPSCNVCPFRRTERISDITVGDFWGLKDSNLFASEQNLGTSLILPNTAKGETIVHALADHMTLVERSIQEAVDGNTQLRHPVPRTRACKIFNCLYPTVQFDLAVRLAISDRIAMAFIKKILRPFKPVLMPIIIPFFGYCLSWLLIGQSIVDMFPTPQSLSPDNGLRNVPLLCHLEKPRIAYAKLFKNLLGRIKLLDGFSHHLLPLDIFRWVLKHLVNVCPADESLTIKLNTRYFTSFKISIQSCPTYPHHISTLTWC